MRLRDVPELGGRSLCSSQSYERGDVVISKELPHVCFPSLPSSDADFARILGICTKVLEKSESELDPEAVAACAHACLLRSNCKNLDLEDYYAPKVLPSALLQIADELGVENGRDFVKFILVNLFNSHHRGGQIMLYAQMSKMAHSCDPNIRLKFESETELSAIAIRPIVCDEPLTFSYLSEGLDDENGLIWGTVIDRRTKLQKTKQFECRCRRCIEESGASTPNQVLPRKIRISLAGYFNTLEPRLVDWEELRKVRSENSSSLNQLQLAGLNLALARQDLIDIPERYGQGIAISDGKLREGAGCLDSVLPQIYDQTFEGLFLSGVLPFIPPFSKQLERIPKSIKLSKSGIIEPIARFVERSVAALEETRIFLGEDLTNHSEICLRNVWNKFEECLETTGPF